MAGEFIWYELLTTDLEKSASFFAGLLDADVLRTDDDEAPSYFIAAKGTDSPLFGLVPMRGGEGRRSHWIGYMMVDDLAQALALVEESGGAIHALSDDEEGRGPDDPKYAVVTDSQGAVITLHERVDGAFSQDSSPEPGRLAWVELQTTDRHASNELYQQLGGFQMGPEHVRGEEGHAHGIFRGGRLVGLVRDLPAGSPVPPNWVYYLRVPDLDRAIAHARQLGGFMYEDPAEVDGGKRALLLDPTGAPVALWAATTG